MGYITTRLEEHPATRFIPDMDSADLVELENDIRQNGQLFPVITCGGKVIDGRARLKVLRKLRMEPIIEKLDADVDPYDFVLSANIHRRHLTKSQIAMILSEMSDRNAAARKALGVSDRLVQQANRVHKIAAPEVVRAVDSGRMSLNVANRLADLPVEKQAMAVEQLDAGVRATEIARVDRPARPAESGSPITPESIVEQFRKCPDRLETIKQLIAELAEHERIIAAGFFGVAKPPAPKEPEPQQLVQTVMVENTDPVVERIDRVSDELIDSPRMAALAQRLSGDAGAVGTVRLLLRAADRHAIRGDIGVISDAAIASECGWVGDPSVFVGILVTEGWLVRDIEHRLLIVGWEGLSLGSSSEAVKQAGGYAQPTGVPKIKEKLPKRVRNQSTPIFSVAFEEFWTNYPPTRKQAKNTAWKRWQTALKSVPSSEQETNEEFLVRRCKEFAASEVGKSKYCPAPAVWLNGGRYDDAPEAWSDGTVKPITKPDPDFDRFWLAVPATKRVKHAETRREWDYALTAVEPQDDRTPAQWLIDRMTAYAKSYQGRSKFAACPSDWLRDGRYFDEDKAWEKLDDSTLEKSAQVVVRRKMTPFPGMERPKEKS